MRKNMYWQRITFLLDITLLAKGGKFPKFQLARLGSSATELKTGGQKAVSFCVSLRETHFQESVIVVVGRSCFHEFIIKDLFLTSFQKLNFTFNKKELLMLAYYNKYKYVLPLDGIWVPLWIAVVGLPILPIPVVDYDNCRNSFISWKIYIFWNGAFFMARSRFSFRGANPALSLTQNEW